MVLKVLKILLLILGIITLGLAIYAHLQNDPYLRSTALSLLSVMLAAAYAFGIFRRKPVVQTPAPAPARPAVQDNSAPRQRRQNPEPRPAPTAAIDANEDLKDDELYIVFSRLAGHKTGDTFRANVQHIIDKNGLPDLTAEDIDRLAAEIDRRDLRGKTFKRTPGIALVRMQRADLDVEYGGTSWLGGLPTLGDTPWPRDESGRAMHHLAQIDLDTVPDPLLPKGMPKKGALAFFMTTATDAPHRGRVIYSPTIGNVATEPPSDLVPIYHGPDWGYYVKGHARESAPDTFPRWPVEFVLLPMTNQNRDDDAHELMGDLLPFQAAGELSPQNYRQSLPDFARPWFWDTAYRFTMSVRLARDDVQDTLQKAKKRVQQYGPGYQAAVDTIRRDQDAFSAFVDEVSIWAVSNEPWDRMTPEDIAQLETYFAQVRDNGAEPGRFKPFYQFTQGEFISVQEVAKATLVAVANAAPEVYATLPFEVRDDIDTRYRIANVGRWHQMFGLGFKIGAAASTHTHHHLLLQLHSDQLVNWMWDDRGVVQFWISEDDLLAQNWDAVEMTLESR
jgi:hypothetical protein